MQWVLPKKSNKSILNSLLLARGLKTKKQKEIFLNPDYKRDLHSPYLMKHMGKAVKRIMRGIDQKQKICIFADYDADGVSAASILVATLKYLRSKSMVYIPDRSREGYGLNLKAIRELAEKKVNLIITVDCGITDLGEIKLANKLGIDVIITDHHLVPDKVPFAYVIINPRQESCKYPFKELAGCGVAFKLAQGLMMHDCGDEKSSSTVMKCKSHVSETERERRTIFLKWLLDLVAVGTVADCMPLLGENRVLVKYGLIVLSKAKNLGFKELMLVAGINPKALDSYSLGFQIGPRLNAAGRMDHANISYKLLNTNSPAMARKLAKKLDKKNSQRQRITGKIINDIRAKILNKQGNLIDLDKKLIFEVSNDWPIGVLGLAAGRICDQFFKPTIVLSKLGKYAKGSGRSIPCLNMVKAVTACDKLLEEYGGHAQAIGLTLKTKNILVFKKKLFKIVNKELAGKKLKPKLKIDARLKLKHLNFDFYKSLEKLRPFGNGNLAPILLLQKMQIQEMRCVGKEQNHLRMMVCDPENKRKCFKSIGFNCSHLVQGLKIGDLIDIVFELEIDEWNGRRSLQLNIKDLRKA